MKLYTLLAIASVSIGVWAGLQGPTDRLPADLAKYDRPSDMSIVLKIAETIPVARRAL
jgi:hypothetical protein